MKRMKSRTIGTLVGVGLFGIGLTLLQSNVFAQSGPGAKTTSVVVTNSDTNPVAVNAVAKRTIQLLSASGVELPAGGKREWQIDVRGYSRIKVCSLGSYWFSVYVTDMPNLMVHDIASSFDGVVLGIASVYGQTQEDFCRSIDFLPESVIYITAINQANEPAKGNVRVWAQ